MRHESPTGPSVTTPAVHDPERSAAAHAQVPVNPDAFTTPYRDPVWEGPTDPVLVPDHLTGEWVLFYTQRRATQPGLTGVEWVHGTAIGVARSSDGGHNWAHQGTVDGLVPPGTELPVPCGRPTSCVWVTYGSCT